jgi:hypothetical protein
LVLSLSLAATAFAAGHDLAPSVYDAPASGAGNPQIAWNGSKYLALWQTNGAVFGAFIAADGTPLNSLPIAFPDILGAAAGSMRLAAIGNDFLVVLPAFPPHTATIHSDGTVVVDQPKLDVAQLGQIELAVNGTDIAIADRYSSHAYFFTSSGTLKRTVDLPSQSYGTAIAAWKNGFIAAIQTSDGISVMRFDRDGNFVATTERIAYLPDNHPFEMHIASSGDEALLVWSEYISLNSPHSRAARLADRAKVIGLPGPPTSAAWTGSSYLVATSVGYVRVSHDGVIIDTTPLNAGPPVTLAAHDDLAYGLTAEGVGIGIVSFITVLPGQPVRLALAPRSQMRPLIASNGNDFLSMWTETSPTNSDVGSITVDRNGVPASTPDMPARAFATRQDGLAFSGATYLAIYVGNSLQGQRFSASGQPLDDKPFVIRDGQVFATLVTAAPHGFLVSWTDNTAVRAAFIGEDGSVGEVRSISLPRQGVIEQFGAAFDGRQFLFIYATDQPGILIDGPQPTYQVYAIRFAADLTPIDSVPLTLETSASRASVATNGHDFLVVVDRYLGRDVVAFRIDANLPALQVKSKTTLLDWFNSNLKSDVAWDGRDYVVASRHDAWLSILRVDAQSSRTAAIKPAWDALPSLAATSTGEVVAVLAEYPDRFDTVRARSYAEAELPPTEARPPAPEITSFTNVSSQVSIAWTSAASDIEQFVIEGSSDGVTWTTLRTLDGASRATTSAGFWFYKLFRIRAVRKGVVSEPAPVTAPRRRSVRA